MMAKELIQVFIIKLINNMTLKYKSEDPKQRKDSYLSAKLLCIISNQFLNKDKVHYKQFQMLFNQICQYINANYQPEEKKNWVILYKQQQGGQMEKMHIVDTDEYHLA